MATQGYLSGGNAAALAAAANPDTVTDDGAGVYTYTDTAGGTPSTWMGADKIAYVYDDDATWTFTFPDGSTVLDINLNAALADLDATGKANLLAAMQAAGLVIVSTTAGNILVADSADGGAYLNGAAIAGAMVDPAVIAALDGTFATDTALAASDAADLDKIADSFTSTGLTIVNSGTGDALDLDVVPATYAQSGVAMRCLPETKFTDLDMLPFGKASTIAPLNGHCSCVGATWSLVSGSEVNVLSVVINADGTHTVEPAPQACEDGTWSYEYTETCPDGSSANAVVSGLIDTTKVEIARFSTNNAAGQSNNLSLVLALGGTYNIDWGDGTVDTGVASGTAYQSHTYSAAFDGDVVVYANACNSITEIRSTVGYWDFDVKSLPSTLTYVLFQGHAMTISGDLSGLNTPLATYVRFQGNAMTISGDLSGLNTPLTTFVYFLGNAMTFSGDLSGLNIPLATYVSFYGHAMTISGDLSGLDTPLATYVRFYGHAMTISGDLSGLDTPLATYVYFYGHAMTISGDLSGLDIPLATTVLFYGHAMTISGDLSGLNTPLATYVYFYGNAMTISGDLSGLDTPLATYVYFYGNAMTISVPSNSWPFVLGGFRYLLIRPSSLTQTEVDNVLVAATSVTSWASEKYVDVSGNNAAPSAVGTAAVATLISNGATTVVTN